MSPRVVVLAGLVVAGGLAFAAALQLGFFPGAAPEAGEDVADLEAGRLATNEGTAGKAGQRALEGAPADRFAAVEDTRGDEGAVADRKGADPGRLMHRSAPKAVDLTTRDLVKTTGLLKMLGGEGRGSVTGEAVGFGGLGLRGAAAGGGGAVGLGGLGTKGRGGGRAAFGSAAGFGAAVPEAFPSQPLKAGATDDNAAFDKFVQFLSTWSDRDDTAGLADLIDVRDRRFVKVVDANGLPIPTANVQVVGLADQTATTGKTYGDGRLPFYPRAQRRAGGSTDYRVEATFGGQTASAAWDGAGDLTLTFDADRAVDGALQLDVLFALDTTGSMGDEIDRIKATLLSVTERLRGLPQRFDLRYGAVLYRDQGDDYVTRPLPFTSDVQGFMRSLRGVEAGGGGDEPESVNRALADVVAARWRPGAAKVVFLIGDAPPHMDYPGDVRYGETMRAALGKGIRIHSIAASGLDAPGTLVWRQVAQYTRGKFVFIEYGSAQATAAAHGVGGGFKSNNLDDILFEQIRDELDGWGQGEPQQAAREDARSERYAGPIQLHPRGR